MSTQSMKEIRNNNFEKIEVGQLVKINSDTAHLFHLPSSYGLVEKVFDTHIEILILPYRQMFTLKYDDIDYTIFLKETQSITGVGIDSVSRQAYKAIVQECLGFMEQAQTMLYDIAFICSECLDPDNLIDVWQDNTRWNARMFICPTRIAFCPGLNHESQTFAIHQKNTNEWKELQITVEPSYPLWKEPAGVMPDNYKFANTVTLVNCSI